MEIKIKEGSGFGLVLKIPQRVEVTYALRFNFQTSNSEAEYEALLADLRIIDEMRGKHVTTMSE